MRAFHRQFGEGSVLRDEGNTLVIEFQQGIQRCPRSEVELRELIEDKIAARKIDNTEKCIVRMEAALIRSINDTWGVFSISAIDLLPHQLWVCNKALQHWPIRYLVADDVGLGKTIEAGLILWPLIESKRVQRLLILTPAPLVEQWQHRLGKMFDIRLNRYASDQDTDKSDFWVRNNFVVASLPTLQADNKGRHDRFFEADPWDLVIVDEAHHLNFEQHGGRTLGYQFIEKMQEHNKMLSCLFFTGTPHRGKDYGFFALMRLLAPDVFNPKGDISKQYRELAKYLIRNNKQNVTDMLGNRIFKPITQHPETFSYSPEEQLFYNKLTEFIMTGRAYAMTKDGRAQTIIILVLIALQKLASSSVAAVKGALVTRRNTLAKLQEEITANIDEIDDNDDAMNELDKAIRNESIILMENEIEGLTELITLAENVKTETRITRIIEIIKEKYPDDNVLLFTEYKRTQALMLAALIDEYGENSVRFINGDEYLNGILLKNGKDLKLKYSRESTANSFNSGTTRFLVSTEAAGEGIDLQENCHILIHIDLPWNPMRLHQRVGRINRYGQTKGVEVVSVRNPGTVESRIWDLLQEKLISIKQMFANATDDPEDLMQLVIGLQDTNFYNNLYSKGAAVQNLTSWFDAETQMLGGISAVQTVQNLVGNAAKFNLAGLNEVPKLDLPDLAPFFKATIKLAQRRLTISSDDKFSFLTPDSWNNEYAIKERYENLVFKRKTAEGEICGVGHKIFSKALDFALSFTDNVCIIDSSFSYFVYRIYDKITYQKGSIENRYVICKWSDKQTVECISEECFYRELLSLKESIKNNAMPNAMLIPDNVKNSIRLEEYKEVFREPACDLFALFCGVCVTQT
jgi:SNF2 family DNA or RNA helicase